MVTTYIVFTTINMPSLLDGYATNLKRYGHEHDVGFIVIGDYKTPAGTAEYIKQFTKQGIEAIYLGVEEQKKWLNHFPKLEAIIPYNSDNRRNIGYLVAIQRGGKTVICIDDDNYVTESDFVMGHQIAGSNEELTLVSSNTGWFNICSLMDCAPARTIYPRGLPYSKRWQDEIITTKQKNIKVAINAGLWLEDPDVDAVTRLNERVRTVALNKSRIALEKDTWSPINTQNTTFYRDVLPCFYYVEMGSKIKGMAIDRYGDIWAGYLARKVIDQMDEYVVYGNPLTIHKRNQHNLLKDLQEEFWGMIFTEDLVKMLGNISLSSKGYGSLYLELAGEIEKSMNDYKNNPEMYSLFMKIANNMKIWVDACSRIM